MNPGTQPNSDLAADPCSVLPSYGFSYTLHCDLKCPCKSGSSSRLTFRWLLLISFTAVGRINTGTEEREAREPVLQPRGHRQDSISAAHQTIGSLCWTPSTFPRSHNAPDCTLHPSLPDTFPSHHHCTQHDAPPDTFAGTSEILPSTWKEPISWSLFCFSADCTMCHSFSKLICCFRETWNLWEHVNSSTIYAPLQICNTDWNWHSRWPTPYISLTKNCLVIHFSSLAN